MNACTKTIAVLLFSLPLLAQAAGKTASASMQVTFEVKEACSVQTSAAATAASSGNTTPAANAAPAVACQLNSPYQLVRADAAAHQPNNQPNNQPATSAAPAAQRQQTGAGEWTITF